MGRSNWGRTKKRWRNANPPDEADNYDCAICLKPVASEEMSLDHILRVEDFPQFKHQLWNLQPTHERCNMLRDAVLVWGKHIHTISRPDSHLPEEYRVTIRRILTQADEWYAKYEYLNADVNIISIKELDYERIS